MTVAVSPNPGPCRPTGSSDQLTTPSPASMTRQAYALTR